MSGLSELRAMSGILQKQPVREYFRFSFLKNGIPRGALTEICGPQGGGKTEMVLRFLAENEKLKAAWIEERMSAYPCAFPLLGVGLNRVLFVDAGKEFWWVAQQALRSRLFGVVVLSGSSYEDLTQLRRLQIAAEHASASVIFLSERRVRAWPIAFQVQVRRPEIRVLKNHG